MIGEVSATMIICLTGRRVAPSADESVNSTVETALRDLPFARATVHRKGVRRPTVVVIRWDEALPAVDHWRALWQRKPVTLFGAHALRTALRRAFRDVIGDQYGPDEQHTEPTTDEGTDQ